MTTHLSLIGPNPDPPVTATRETVMDSLVTARERICDLYGIVGDPALTGHVRGGGTTNPTIVQQQITKAHEAAVAATEAEQAFRRALDDMHRVIDEESR